MLAFLIALRARWQEMRIMSAHARALRELHSAFAYDPRLAADIGVSMVASVDDRARIIGLR